MLLSDITHKTTLKLIQKYNIDLSQFKNKEELRLYTDRMRKKTNFKNWLYKNSDKHKSNCCYKGKTKYWKQINPLTSKLKYVKAKNEVDRMLKKRLLLIECLEK